LIFRPALIANIPRFVLNMRAEDVEEMKALHGADFTRGLRQAMCGALGYQVWEGWSERGEPQAIFGISEPQELGSQIFMVGSASLVAQPKWFLRTSSQIVGGWARLSKETGGLYCWVDDRNVTHMRYLRHLGFEIAETRASFGPKSLPFHLMRNELHASVNV
jgi:hypothetical protein